MHVSKTNTKEEIKAAGRHLLERLPISDITLIEAKPGMRPEDIRQLFPGRKVCAFDFPIVGIDRDENKTSWGYRTSDIESIDHHYDQPEMKRHISAGNLAITRVLQDGILDPETIALKNHRDCDSRISTLIGRGHLPPLSYLGSAVIAADHTGEEHPVADLLQAVVGNPEISADSNVVNHNLAKLLLGEPLDQAFQIVMEQRLELRRSLKKLAVSDLVSTHGDLILVESPKPLDAELLPAIFPTAVAIMAASPYPKNTATDPIWQVRIRLGQAAPPKFTLTSMLPILHDELDNGLGGRWDAISNRRSAKKGSSIAPVLYAAAFSEMLKNALKQL